MSTRSTSRKTTGNKNKNDKVVRISAQKRANLVIPVSRVEALLRRGNFATRWSKAGFVYATAVVEYIVTEVIEIAGWKTLNAGRKRIAPKDILAGIHDDKELRTFLSGDSGVHIAGAGWVQPLLNVPAPTAEASSSQPSQIFPNSQKNGRK